MTSDADRVANVLMFARLKAGAIGSSAREVLSQMFLAAGEGLADGGTRVISGSVNGKAFTFQVDPNWTNSDAMTAIRSALSFVGTYTDTQLDAMNVPASSYGRICF